MAKFVFRLDPVLEQRKALEGDRQREVAALERQRIDLEQQVRRSQLAIQSHKQDMREALGGVGERRIDPASLRLQSSASLRLVGDTQRLALRLAGVYQKLEQARERLREATAARKAVDLLKERQREAWLREQERKEAAAIDEMVTIRSARGPGSSLALDPMDAAGETGA